MVSEKLKKWVKSKRKDGISDERIKKSLERTGHDPSVLDELDNPFEEDDIDTDSSAQNSDVSEEDEDFEFSDEDVLDTEAIEQDEETEEDSKETKSKLKELQQDFNAPSSSLSSLPHFSRKKLGAGIFLILLVAGGIAAYGFMPDDFNLLESVDEETGPEPGSLEQLDSQNTGCPDAAVRVQSVSSSNGATTADVQVTREKALVVLKVMKDGELLGFTTDTLLDEAQMTVEEVGDQVELRPLGCKERYSLRDY